MRFDFGRSLLYDRPVRDLIPERAANTAVLALTALVAGHARRRAARRRHRQPRAAASLPDAIRAASVVLLSMPPLLTSLFLVFVAARTGWLPIGGMRSATVRPAARTLDLLRHLVVPALALGAAARRDARAPAGAGDERSRSASRSCSRRSRAACRGRASSGATR